MSKRHDGVKAVSKKKANGAEPIVVGFGTRAISDQNFSKIVALPKVALENFDAKAKYVSVYLVQTDSEKFLKLVPTADGE